MEMYIFNPLKQRKANLLRKIHIGCLLGSFLITMGFFVFSFHEKELDDNLLIENDAPILDFNRIGYGPLALAPSFKNEKINRLIQDLIFIGKNDRPDHEQSSKICLALKNSLVEKAFGFEEPVFFSQDKLGNYYFSETSSDLSATFCLPETGSSNSETLLLCIRDQVEAPEYIELFPHIFFRQALENEGYVRDLAKAKFWGQDMFLVQMGGEEYKELASKYKIEIDNQVYLLAIGDCLWWDGTTWKQETKPDNEKPITRLTKVDYRESYFQIWDSQGYMTAMIRIPFQQPTKSVLKGTDCISSVRLRLPHEMICQLGKRRVLIKEGDWWVRNKNQWHRITTTDDLERFILHKLNGELFVFEKIENEKGAVVLKGRYFDQMRISEQKFQWAFNLENKYKQNNSPTVSRLPKNKPLDQLKRDTTL